MKNYLVIGAATGIGRALADDLLEAGHTVFSTYHTSSIDTSNSHETTIPLDVTEDKIDLTDKLPESIDGLAYCPGTINLKPFARIKPEDFETDYQLQVIGAIKVIQAVLPKLKKANQSSIVLFSTVAVQHGFNFHSQVSASKGAIEGLARALAAEFAPKIRVNVVAPSLTQTPLASTLLSSEDKIKANADRHPLKKVGQPEDIAATASFLLGEKSSWISGQVIPVDGGMSSIRG